MNTRSRPYRCSIATGRAASARPASPANDAEMPVSWVRLVAAGTAPLGEVAESSVAQPHGEDDAERRREERQQMVVAEHRLAPPRQWLAARRRVQDVGTVAYVGGHGTTMVAQAPNPHEIVVRVT